jgi:hypothetical protein
MECMRNFVVVSEVQNGENVSCLFQKDSNMPWVDCTLNSLPETSFEGEKKTKVLAETLQISRMQI